MKLLTPIQSVNASLADDARHLAAHLAAAAQLGNRMVSRMTSLDDAALTNWLNSQPPEDTIALFTAHGQLGTLLNDAAAVAATVLDSSGLSVPITPVDVRSVAEKLAELGRELTFENGVFAVTTPEPAPEP